MRCLEVSELSVKERHLLERLKAQPELKPLFFRKVKGLKWFNAFRDEGYLNAEGIPEPMPSEQEGYLIIPPWIIGEYLVKTAPELKDKDDYVQHFLKIISDGTEYAKEKSFSNYRVWCQFAQVVSEIPSRFISEEFIDDVVDYWLDDKFGKDGVLEQIAEKWFPEVLKEKKNHAFWLALKLLEVLYKVEIEKLATGRNKILFRTDTNEINRITDKVAYASGRGLGAHAISVFHSKLEKMLESLDNDSWSSIWQPFIKETGEKYLFDPENVLVKAYRKCMNGWFENCPEEACDYVGKMIESRFQTIQRLAIHCITDQFSACRKYAEKLVDERFFNENFLREFWPFINRNYAHFDSKQKDKIIKIIENRKILDAEGSLDEVLSAYKQAQWFAAVKEYGERENRLYEKAVAIAGTEPKPSEFLSLGRVEFGWITEEAEGLDDELSALSSEELVRRLSAGDIELARTVRPRIKAFPLRYYRDLAKFKNLGFPCLHAIIRAYNELWEEKTSLPWNDVWGYLLEFFSEIVKLEESEETPFAVGRREVVSAIAVFLESGAQSDDHSFHPDHHAAVESLIDYILKNEKGAKFEKTQEKVFTAINTPRGNCIQALINLTLLSCRLSHRDGSDDHSETWKRFQHYYDDELKRAESGEFEFSTLVTVYLSNFLYMSREWVLSNLDKIFDQANYMKWLCAMEGYYYVRTVYQEIYRHLSEKGNLSRALDDENIPGRVKSRVIEHIATAYINDFDILKDDSSMIKVLIVDRRICPELEILVHVVMSFQEIDGGRIRNKIYELWPLLTDAADFSTREGRALASSLCRWSAFVDHLDTKSMELLLKIAPYADESYTSRELLESLARLSEKQPFEVNKIWLEILERSAPTYPEKPIRQILINLIAEGDEGKRAAEEIVDRYIKRGVASPSKLLIKILDKS